MNILKIMFQKIINKTSSKTETDIFLDFLESSYNSWLEERDNRTEDEEKAYFIKRMQNWGFEGNTYEEALDYLDQASPSNCRREHMKNKVFKKTKHTL